MVQHLQEESPFNRELGGLLRPMLRPFEVRAENLQVLTGKNQRKKPDILITAPRMSPVTIECEYRTGARLEREARARLGAGVQGYPRPVEASIALAYPPGIRGTPDEEIRAVLEHAEFEYAIHHSERERFPKKGWMKGNVADLAEMVSLASLPQRSVQRSIEALSEGIELAATHLDEMARDRPAASAQVAHIMEMPDSPQTRRIACSILANALIFQEKLAGVSEGYLQTAETSSIAAQNPKHDTIAMWETILRDNYWPIFAIAKDILHEVVNDKAAPLLAVLVNAVDQVTATGIENTRDLAGHVFQRFVEDREYLAAYYTLPLSASLLAQLAVAKMEGVDWADPEAVTNLRMADFACGTGALLSAAYEQIRGRYEREGGNPADIHRRMMQKVLHGFDVVPAAVHLTASTLSGAEPTVPYQEALVYRMPYGRVDSETVAVGSLEYLRANSQLTHSNYTNPAIAMGGRGPQTATATMADAMDSAFDLIIMNPPFKSNTSHEGLAPDVATPAFAGLGTSEKDADDMSQRAKRLSRNTCQHGNAGLASAFAALAHRKVKPGGVVALVLPLSAAAGVSWEKFREMLAKDYTDVTVISIGNRTSRMSFSADTGMGECLVVARRLRRDEKPGRAVFCSLRERPDSYSQVTALSRALNRDQDSIRRLEDGPYGGSVVSVGDDDYGQIVTTLPLAYIYNWPVRTRDYSLAQAAYQLCQGELWLPQMGQRARLPVDPMSAFSRRGPVDRDVTGPAPNPDKEGRAGEPRGPFSRRSPHSSASPYPCLWNHHNDKETKLVCQPDGNLEPRPGHEERAQEQWDNYACRLHMNSEFTFGSQPLAMAYTDEDVMGGRVWPSVVIGNARQEKALSLFSNSTLGILLYWWQSSRQQSSKATLKVSALPDFITLNPSKLTEEQLQRADAVFDEMREKTLRPAAEAGTDRQRARLDRAVLCDVLGLEEALYECVRHLARALSAEPSISPS